MEYSGIVFLFVHLFFLVRPFVSIKGYDNIERQEIMKKTLWITALLFTSGLISQGMGREDGFLQESNLAIIPQTGTVALRDTLAADSIALADSSGMDLKVEAGDDKEEFIKEEFQQAGQALKESFQGLKEGLGSWFNENIKVNATGDYADIQRQNNQLFADMLRNPSSWGAYTLQMNQRPEYEEGRFFTNRTKPSSDTARGKAIRYLSVIKPYGKIQSPVPETYYSGAGTDAVSQMISKQQFSEIKFFGQTLKLVYEPSIKAIGLGKSKEKQIAKFWQYLADENHAAVIAQLYQYKEELKLNDYQYYQLVRAFADVMFAKGKHGESLAFTVFILNQTGYDARLGKLQTEKKLTPVILLPVWEEVYGMPYILIGDNPYYLVDVQLRTKDMKESVVQTYSKAFASATHPLSIQIDPAGFGMDPLYGMFEGYVYNERLAEMEFSLPAGPMGIYLDEPFSNLMEKTFSYRLKPAFDSMIQKKQESDLRQEISNAEKQQMRVLQLSSFIEQSLSYQSKRSSRLTGHYLYPDLMFWKKGAGDIWDRSVLFCQIANRIFDIPTVLLLYRDYAIPAVCLAVEDLPATSPFRAADYVEYNGKAYFLLGRIPKSVDTSVFPQVFVW